MRIVLIVSFCQNYVRPATNAAQVKFIRMRRATKYAQATFMPIGDVESAWRRGSLFPS